MVVVEGVEPGEGQGVFESPVALGEGAVEHSQAVFYGAELAFYVASDPAFESHPAGSHILGGPRGTISRRRL